MRGGAFLCSPLSPGGQKSVLRLGSRACAVAHFKVLAAVAQGNRVGTADADLRMRGGSFWLAAASRWTNVGTAARAPRIGAFVLCSLLPPGDQNSVLQLWSCACAVPHFQVLAAAALWTKLGTASWGAAHAQWRLRPTSLLPPCGQQSVLRLRRRACALKHSFCPHCCCPVTKRRYCSLGATHARCRFFVVLAPAAPWTSVGTAGAARRMRGGAFSRALYCRSGEQRRYCSWEAAHAR